MGQTKNMESFITNAIENKKDEESWLLINEEEMFGTPRITIVGCGGAGGNTITRLNKLGVKGADTIAINTDKQALDLVEADHKILIGGRITRGLGGSGFVSGTDAENVWFVISFCIFWLICYNSYNKFCYKRYKFFIWITIFK